MKSSKCLNFNHTFWRCGFGRSTARMNNHIDNVKFFSIVFVPSGKQKKMENEENKENKKKNKKFKIQKVPTKHSAKLDVDLVKISILIKNIDWTLDTIVDFSKKKEKNK